MENIIKRLQNQIIDNAKQTVHPIYMPQQNKDKVCDYTTLQSTVVKEQIAQIFFNAPNGWKLCSSKANDLSDKFREIILDNLGNHFLGDYEYIDDCACQLDGGLGHFGNKYKCNCACHNEVKYYTEKIENFIESTIQAYKEELIEEVEKMKEIGEEEKCKYDIPHPRAYNKGIEDIIRFIKNK